MSHKIIITKFDGSTSEETFDNATAMLARSIAVKPGAVKDCDTRMVTNWKQDDNGDWVRYSE